MIQDLIIRHLEHRHLIAIDSTDSKSYNVYLGYHTALEADGFKSIVLGSSAALTESDLHEILWIENSPSSVPLLFGNFGIDRLGINCTLPQATLSVAGSIRATGNITASSMACSSDRRLKRNIISLEHSREMVRHLRPVRYQWRREAFPERHFNDREQIGFIAQEVEEIYPELIHTAEDGYKSMDYARLSVVLIKSLQEITEKNQELKLACEQLEAQLEVAEKKQKTVNSEGKHSGPK